METKVNGFRTEMEVESVSSVSSITKMIPTDMLGNVNKYFIIYIIY